MSNQSILIAHIAAKLIPLVIRNAAREERPGAARMVLERRTAMQAPATMRALVFLGLGSNETALDLLEDGLAAPGRYDPYLKVHPMYDPLRQNPRYQRILEKVGLDETSVRRTTDIRERSRKAPWSQGE